MIDDTPENVCAARCQGMHAILVNKSLPGVGGILLSLLQDPLQRAQSFLKDNARNHYCIFEGHEKIRLKGNFTQLMIWELTDDEDIIYIKWPYGKIHGIHPSENGHLNGHSNGQSNGHSNGYRYVTSDVKNGLWIYFFEAPVLTTREFPADADTTSTAYLSILERYVSTVPNIHLVLKKITKLRPRRNHADMFRPYTASHYS